MAKLKQCAVCGFHKENEDFPVSWATPDGFGDKCKKCRETGCPKYKKRLPALCPDCGKSRRLVDGSRGTETNRTSSGVVVQACKSCSKKKPEGVKKTRTEVGKAQRQLLKVRCIQHLGAACADCGLPYNGTNGCAFEFHHRDPAEKSFGISEQRRAWSLLLSELEKCDLLCAICHRKRHSEAY